MYNQFRHIGEAKVKPSNILSFIFISFFKISLFVIGGGFAMMPVIEDVFCNKNKLLKKEEILDMIAITQIIPGLTAINAAIFVGHKLAGIKGSVFAVLGVVLPSLIIASIAAALFSFGEFNNPHITQALSCVRACVASLFCVIAYRIGKNVLNSAFNYVVITLFLIALFLGMPPVMVPLISIPTGIIYTLIIKLLRPKDIL